MRGPSLAASRDSPGRAGSPSVRAVSASLWRRFLLAEALGAAAVALFLCSTPAAGEPWNLTSYELCYHVALADIPAEASGVTYSSVTDSIYVITRRPQAVMEYDLKGNKLRQISHRGLHDPEGITWMYGYTFAVAQEGGGRAAITIMELAPWSRSAHVLRTLILPQVQCQVNFCFEGVTFDMYKNVFYAVQEMDPMRVWEVTPSGKATNILNGQTEFSGLRDLADVYYMPKQDRLFVLSQTEQKVAEVRWDGSMVPGQLTAVYDNVVEGLSFTPDGHLMFTLGEPNDLWVYTSTGKCDWEPKPWMIAPVDSPDKRQVQMEGVEGSSDAEEEAAVDGGFCNWNNCVGGQQGSAWCNADYENCVRGCAGMWCWHDTIGQAIDKKELVFAPSPPLDGRRSDPGAGEEHQLAAATPEPTRAKKAPAPARPSTETAAGTRQKSWEDASGSNNDGGRVGNETSAARPPTNSASRGNPSTREPNGTAVENTERESNRVTDSGKVVIPIKDASFKDGFIAVLSVAIYNVDTGKFGQPLMQLRFREAIAQAAYGSRSAFLDVVFNSSTADDRSAVFSGILFVPDMQTDEALVSELLQGLGYGPRRLAQADSNSEDFIVLTVRLLGTTANHAELLANRTEHAITSGELVANLKAAGFPATTEIEVLSVQILGSGMAPQYYPVIQKGDDDLPNVTYGDDFQVIEVTVEDRASPSTAAGANDSGGSDTTTIAIAAGGAAAGVVAIAACAAAVRCMAKRRYLAGGVQPRHTGGVRESRPLSQGQLGTSASVSGESLDSDSTGEQPPASSTPTGDLELGALAKDQPASAVGGACSKAISNDRAGGEQGVTVSVDVRYRFALGRGPSTPDGATDHPRSWPPEMAELDAPGTSPDSSSPRAILISSDDVPRPCWDV